MDPHRAGSVEPGSGAPASSAADARDFRPSNLGQRSPARATSRSTSAKAGLGCAAVGRQPLNRPPTVSRGRSVDGAGGSRISRISLCSRNADAAARSAPVRPPRQARSAWQQDGSCDGGSPLWLSRTGVNRRRVSARRLSARLSSIAATTPLVDRHPNGAETGTRPVKRGWMKWRGLRMQSRAVRSRARDSAHAGWRSCGRLPGRAVA
jgi:hypothetical protein